MKVGRTGTCSSDWSCILIPRFFAVNVVRILSHDRLIPEFPPFRPLEDSMDEQPKARNPFCRKDLSSTETQRNRCQVMPSA